MSTLVTSHGKFLPILSLLLPSRNSIDFHCQYQVGGCLGYSTVPATQQVLNKYWPRKQCAQLLQALPIVKTKIWHMDSKLVVILPCQIPLSLLPSPLNMTLCKSSEIFFLLFTL